MERPENPYKKGTLAFRIVEDWISNWPDGKMDEMTSRRISDTFGCPLSSAKDAMRKIKKDFGLSPHEKSGVGRPKKGKCETCRWWDKYCICCLFCFLTGHPRRRNDGVCLEYRRGGRGRKSVS